LPADICYKCHQKEHVSDSIFIFDLQTGYAKNINKNVLKLKKFATKKKDLKALLSEKEL
jgi:hypothetical protein